MRPPGLAPALAPALAPTVFSTVGVPAGRRVQLWETHNATALIGLDVHATGPLEATEVNIALPEVQLARVAGSAHAVRRTSNVIARSPADAIAVYLTLRGDASFSWADGTRAVRPGNVLVCETDQPFTRGFARGLEELVVKAPRDTLAARGAVPRLRRPVVASFGPGGATDRYARALARMTARATRLAGPSPADEGTILDLVAVLAAGRAAAAATAHRAAARCYIEEHLTDPALGAAQVAAAIGLSERQLSRVFAAGDSSVPGHILARRLRLAYSILRRAAGAACPVADVAARCGFTSATYFSHAFRAHFGQRAGDVRREASAAAQGF